MRKFAILATLGCTAFFSSMTASAAPIEPLIVQLEHKSSSPIWDNATIVVTVTNRGSSDVFLPKPFTPLFTPQNHLMTNVFTVVDESNAEARYIGRYVHVLPRDPSTYYEKLAPGETLSHEVNVTTDYELRPEAKYTISYEQPYSHTYSFDERGELFSERLIARSNSLNVSIRAGTSSPQSMVREEPNELICTAPQKERIEAVRWTVDAWRSKASRKLDSLYAVESQTDAQGLNWYYGRVSTDSAYNFWFGEPTKTAEPYRSTPRVTTYWKTTEDFLMYRSLNLIFSNIGFSYSCGCPGYPETTAAWAETLAPGKMHICNFFFELPDADGTNDSKVLVLLHEISHFIDSDGGESHDFAYGRKNSHALTTSNRALAVKNADNLMYFIGTANE